ncbi:MFS transporter [Paenibacillus beijingensis]|uniref:MFS transporter n=2 Tax=Paenibacillus beijingensis TaxID=1126833 RepID=A0A0D5NRK1_9BACL|nr:MFS transporter [Paenibacillus beijingensis]
MEQPLQIKLWTTSFITLTLCYFLLFFCVQLLMSPLPSYVKETFHPGDFTVSLAISLFAASAIAARFAAAALMRKVQRGTILFGGIMLAAGATIAYPYASSVGLLLLLRVLFGFGFGAASTVMPTLVTQIIPPRRLGEGIGYFGLSTSLAMSIGPTIGLYVLDSYGFGLLTVIGAASTILIVPLLLLTRSIPPQPAHPAVLRIAAAAEVSPGDRRGPVIPGNTGDAGTGAARAAAVGSGSEYSSITRQLLPALLNALLSITYGGLLGFIALFGKEVHLAQVGLFFLFNSVTVLIVRPISGRIFDRYGHAPILIPGSAVVAAALALLSYSDTLALLTVSALMYGLGFGAIQPTIQAWMLRVTPPEKHASANSLFYSSIDFGIAAGSMLLGIVASYAGYAGMYRYAAVMMIFFLLVYLASIFAGRRQRFFI